MIYNDSYKGLDDLGEAVERTVKALTAEAHRFDFIAVRGCSGILVGAPVSLRINKPLVVVRKPDENSHGYGKSAVLVNADRAYGRFLFLDDFISSGATERAVLEGLQKHAPEATYVGSFEYCRRYTADTEGQFIWQTDDDDVLASVA
jgi:adenine/guanine phosphoribosyltransferase-like PRPP-binding protein